ncbi:MAG: ABC transporter permease [Pseudomonadota bacterium]
MKGRAQQARPAGSGQSTRRSPLREHGFAIASAWRVVMQYRFTTVMSIALMTIAITLPGLLYGAASTHRMLANQWANSGEFTLFIKLGTPPPAIDALQTRLLTEPRLKAVYFIDRALALEELLTELQIPKLAIGDSNPLPHALIATLASDTDPDQARTMVKALSQEPIVDSVSADFEWVERFRALGNLLEIGGLATAVLLGVGVVLIVGAMTRTLVDQRREEIDVLKLVGATDGYIARPFLYAGGVEGLGAGLVAALLMSVIFWLLAPALNTLLGGYIDGPVGPLAAPPVLWAVMLGTFGGLLGAWLGIRFRLREIDQLIED